MFTGIIQGVGEIVSVGESNTVTSVSINLPDVEGLQIGASVAITFFIYPLKGFFIFSVTYIYTVSYTHLTLPTSDLV